MVPVQITLVISMSRYLTSSGLNIILFLFSSSNCRLFQTVAPPG